ncbi:MAG: hypothetical protein NDI77_13475 [Geobacteraceae bacterium]|nr:hypothetical protein [Geobacteraceae bacterium]
MTALTLKRMKFAIILFYLSLFVGLALYDEKPDPELAREMARPLPEILEPGNAWIVFLGFASPEGVTPYVRGEEMIRKLQGAALTDNNFVEFYKSVVDSKSELSFQGKMPSFYGTKDGGMLTFAAEHPDEIAALLRNNRVLLSRYESLRTYPRYTEPLDYGYVTPSPKFSPLRSAQRTRLLQLAARAGQGDVAGALAGVREDAEFWRFIARSSTTLISKLISFSALNIDLRFAAELGAHRPLNKQEMEIVRDILRPFDNGEVSLAGALRGEARYGQRGMELEIRQQAKNSRGLDSLLFKANATRNRMYADSRDYIRLAGMNPQKFALEVKKREDDNKGIRRIGIPFLYNPAGEILTMIGQSAGMPKYIEKGHNLEGLRRLSTLKVLSRLEDVPPERMQQFLDSHSRELGNPYTGAPMTWDSKKGSISFTDISGEKPIDIIM